MSLFDDLKLGKDKNGNIRITYLGKPFIAINSERVFDIIDDYATKNFIKRVAKLVYSEDDTNNTTLEKARKLSKLYTAKKRQFYKNTKLAHIKESSRDFNCFRQAVSLIELHDVSEEKFLDAQINGLLFTGTFPKPTQLIGSNAEQRLLDYGIVKAVSSGPQFTKDDLAEGSVNFKKLKKLFDDGYSLTLPEVKFLIKYFSIHYAQVPNELLGYEKELQLEETQHKTTSS